MNKITTTYIYKLFLLVFATILLFFTVAPNAIANNLVNENPNYNLAFGFGFGGCYSVVCQVREDCENYINNPSNDPALYDLYKQQATDATGDDYNAICADINYDNSGGTA